MAPFLHTTDTTSKPWCSKILTKVLASSCKPVQKARPIRLKPHFLANWIVSSTLVQFVFPSDSTKADWRAIVKLSPVCNSLALV